MCFDHRPLQVAETAQVRRACQRYLTREDRWRQAWIRKMVEMAITAAHKKRVYSSPELGLNYIHHLYIVRWWYSTPFAYQRGSSDFDHAVFNHMRLLAVLDQPDRFNEHIVVRTAMGGFVTNPEIFVDWFSKQRHWIKYMDRIRVRWVTYASYDFDYVLVEKKRMGNRYSRIH